MDNDDRIIGRILTRREALRYGALSAFAGATALPFLTPLEAASPNAVQIDLVATPQMTEGPFFVDERLNRRDLTTGTERKSVVDGLPLVLAFNLFKQMRGEWVPLEGVQVDVWHADAAGTYSDEPSSGIQRESTSGQKWLRGYQVSDKDGKVEFRTIYPGWYIGRAVHIHFKVRKFDADGRKTAEFTSQLFFDEATNDEVLKKAPYNSRGERRIKNANDGIFSAKQADGTSVGSHLIVRTAKSPSGIRGEFNVALL
ncbi:MAG: intradiol ring-cleavage dioxygenase [Fimbriimonadaceae bacterium]|nr:intradiol ring-cleavage dioxygenase [Fimbriimonadaceae bacterium]